MKNFILGFCRRGLVACGFGPLVLSAVYLILQHRGILETLPVTEVCMGIFSLSCLAFVAGGMNVLYHIERLPLMLAVLIHGGVLYLSYLATYLLNGWLEQGTAAFWVFTGIFVFGYLAIWAVIFCVTKRRTERVNEILRQKQQLQQ